MKHGQYENSNAYREAAYNFICKICSNVFYCAIIYQSSVKKSISEEGILYNMICKKKKIKLLAVCLCIAVLSAAGSGGMALNAAAASGNRTFTTRPTVPVHTYKVYLSPSCQTWNPYCDGSGSEEYHMRKIASAMIPYLKQYGIEYVLAAAQTGTHANQRNTIVNRVKQASYDKCDLYLAIHSNARDSSSKTSGTMVFYPSTSKESLRFANLLKDNFIYPDKSDICLATNDALWEMYMPEMPHCLIETAYHDNPSDVQWIENNTEAIAKNLAYCVALCAYIPVSVSMDTSFVSIGVGKTYDLNSKVTLINHNVYDNRTTWSSNNANIAVVQNGTIKGVSKGCTTINARTCNGLTAKCIVNVS